MLAVSFGWVFVIVALALTRRFSTAYSMHSEPTHRSYLGRVGVGLGYGSIQGGNRCSRRKAHGQQ